IIRLLPNGLKDTSFNRTGRNPNWTLLVRCIVERPDGKVFIGGNASDYWDPKIIRLNESGSRDSSFRVMPIYNNNNNFPSDFEFSGIYDMVLLPSNKLIIVGSFSDAFLYPTNGIIRLHANGGADNSFNTGEPGLQDKRTFRVYSVISKPNGKLFACGFFSGYNNYPCDGTIQIDSSGVIDRSFDSIAKVGPIGLIKKIAVQADGKILVGGRFNQQNGANPKNFSRLLTNGAIDNSFQIGTGANGPVSEVIEQPDGQILVAGGFTNFNGTNCRQMVRLNPNGSIDNTFSIGNGTSADTGDITINKILLQPDGKILVGGSFNLFNGVLKNGLVRLNYDGSIDNTFNTGIGLNSSGEFITDICLLPSGKIIIGGSFNNFNGTPRRNIASLNSDGSIDTTFNVGTGTSGIISTIINGPGNKIIVCGDFDDYNGRTSYSLIRLNNNGSVDSTFRFYVFYLTRLNAFKAVFMPATNKIIVSGFLAGYRYSNVDHYGTFRLFEIDSIGNYDGGGYVLNNYASAMTAQSDNKALIGGDFIFSNPRFSPSIYRLAQGNSCPERATLTVSGSTTLCEGETGLLTSSATTGNIWSTGDTTRSIRVLAGTYAIVSQIVNGCTTASTNFETIGRIGIKYAPEIPYIDFANRDSLIASTDSCTYQWTYNGALQSFTTRKMPVQGFGEYTVRAISNLGCRSRNSQVFSILSARKLKQLVKLDLYPNPATGKVNISTS
ncbi:MAG: delta-60 repeat domain-containing protein, partial [Flexibacteraceae bacterium]